MRWMRRYPVRFFLSVGGILVMVLWAITRYWHWPWLVGYLVSVNLVGFLFYGMDKWMARRGAWRIPEGALHILALCGASPGALIAQKLFHHKTQKRSFQRWVWLIVVLQIVLLLVYFHYVR